MNDIQSRRALAAGTRVTVAIEGTLSSDWLEGDHVCLVGDRSFDDWPLVIPLHYVRTVCTCIERSDSQGGTVQVTDAHCLLHGIVRDHG